MVRPDGWVGAGAYFPGELPRSGGDTREFIGGAVFRDDRFVGEINGDGMTALKIIRGTIETFTLSIEDPIIPDKMLSISLRFPKTPRKRVDLSDEIPRLHITVYPEGNLVGVQSSGVNYEEPYNTEILEEAINRQLNTFMETLIGQAQHEFQADILNFGKTVKRYFRTQGEWEAYDWLNSRFPHAKITVETHTKLRGFGLLRKNAPLSRENSE